MTSFHEDDVTYANGEKNLHYISAGPADGPLIIFMHGWPGIGKTWYNQLNHFAAKGYHVVAPDMPGYGKSTARKIKSDYTQEAIIQGPLALLAHLGREKAIWIAHDWGCGTLWTLARTHPEVFVAAAGLTVPYATVEFGLEELLLLVNRDQYPEDQYPWGQWSYMAFYEQEFEKATAWFDKDIRGFLKATSVKSKPHEPGTIGALANIVKNGGWFGGIPAPPPPSSVPDEAVHMAPEVFEEFVTSMEKTGFWPPDAWYSNHKANREFNLKNGGREARLTFPVLFLEARRDSVCDTLNSRLAEPQSKLVDDLTFVSLDAGHFLATEVPEETNAAIEKWLIEKVK